jgi:hypothetical protein
MGDHGITQTLQGNDPVAVALVTAIRSGDMASLEQLLAAQPALATVRIEGRGGGWRTPLHVAPIGLATSRTARRSSPC